MKRTICFYQQKHRPRRGAILHLFVIMLPIFLMLCGIVVNVAYMQLTKTELRVATDAAARAAGRAFSDFQAVDAAQQYAANTVLLNTVAGVPLQIRSGDYDGEVEFGLVQRTNNGYGRYDLVQKDPNAVRAQTERATAVRINGL